MVASVRLQLLRSPRLRPVDGPAVDLIPRDAALLALLALDGPVPRTRVLRLLWPDDAPDKARSALRQRLFRLRRSAGVEIVCPDEVLALTEAVSHDLQAPRDAWAADAEALPGELLEPLDGFGSAEFADWLAAARERWRTLRRDALAELAAAHGDADRIAPALPYAERLVREEPLLEHAQRTLMRLHYRRGDHGAALQAFDRFRARLAEELGEAPAAETVRLADQIRSGAAMPAAAAPRTPLAVLRPPRRVGREVAWGLLEDALAQGRVLLVTGEPGIGKTRLLQDHADAHGVALRLGARPGDEQVPFALLARLLRRLWPGGRPATAGADELPGWARAELARWVPELGAPAVDAPSDLRLRQALEAALPTLGECGVLVDDLHFADAASLELWPTLMGASARLHWWLGLRSGEVPPSLQPWLRAEPPACARVELAPWTVDELAQLLDSLALPALDARALAPRLQRHTGGRPLFVLETLRCLLSDGAPLADGGELPLPQTLAALVLRRFDALGPAAQRLARVAALAGQDAGVELVARVLGLHPVDLAPAWCELEAAQLLSAEGFVHDLVHDALRRSVPQPVARVLHAQIAAAGEAVGMPPVRAARHWASAGMAREAAHACEQAARQAHDAARLGEEAALLATAAEHHAQAGDGEAAFGALERRIEALIYVDLGRVPDALTALEAAAATPRQRLRACVAAVQACNHLGAHERSLDWLARGQALAAQVGDAALAAELATLGCFALATLDRGDEAAALLEAHRAWFESPAGAHRRREFHADLGGLYARNDRPREAMPLVLHAIDEAMAAGRIEQARVMQVVAALAAMGLGDFAQAERHARRAVALREQVDAQAAAQPVDRYHLGMVLRDLGRFDEAIPLLEACLEAYRELGLPVFVASCETHLAQLWVALGQPARAAALCHGVPAEAPGFVHAHRALVDAERASLRELPMDEPLARAGAALAGRGRAAVRLAHRLLLAGTLEAAPAAALVAEVESEARRHGLQGALLSALALPAPGDDAGRAREALRLLDAGITPLWFGVPQVLQGCARALGRAGDDAGAGDCLRRAAAELQRLATGTVPAPFREAFLHRHPRHRAILAAAARLAPQGTG